MYNEGYYGHIMLFSDLGRGGDRERAKMGFWGRLREKIGFKEFLRKKASNRTLELDFEEIFFSNHVLLIKEVNLHISFA